MPEQDLAWEIEVPPVGGFRQPAKYDPQREEAYHRFCLLPVKGRGALPRLSQEMGIKLTTLRRWRTIDRWPERWIQDVAGAKRALLAESEAVLLTNLRPAMERLGRIAVEGSDRDAVQAVKVLAQIMGIDHPTPNQVNVNVISPSLIAEAREVSKGELKRALAEMSQTHAQENRARRQP